MRMTDGPAALYCSLSLALGSCALPHESPPPRPEEVGGCSHENILPPLVLAEAHRQLLAKRSDPPRTAADYYLALPDHFFGNVEDTTPERRVSFIEIESLRDQWLKAGHFFECDGGGFEVVLRVFETEQGALIAIDEWKRRWDEIHHDKDAPAGEMQCISLGAPRFWRLVEGTWVEAKHVMLPAIDKDWVMERYRNHFKEQSNTPYESTHIWLNYQLPGTGDEIRLTGRGNFMDPDGDPVWQRLRFDGHGFIELPLTD